MKHAEKATKATAHTDTVHEAVGVFDDADTFLAAVDDLKLNGFLRYELSVLSSDKAIEEKLGYLYERVEEAEDDPSAPRTMFVSPENIGNAEGALIGAPLYLAATTSAAIVVASGGTLLSAILAAMVAGVAGTAIGSTLAQFIARRHADYIQNQIDRGGLILWVRLRSPDMENKAKKILKKHSAHDVHVHEIPLYG